MTWEAIIALVVFVFALCGSTGTIVWTVSAQFSSNRNTMWKAIGELSDKIIGKLEYHERHDDERFDAISKDVATRYHNVNNRIWNIELRNAAKDGILPTEYKKNE